MATSPDSDRDPQADRVPVTPQEAPEASEEDVPVRRLMRMVEALVFAAEEPVTVRQIADVYAEVTGREAPDEAVVLRAVERLNRAYEQEERAFRIQAWAGGLRMSTDPAVAPYLKAFFSREQQRRLSRSLMETLAIVAYRQPVTKPEVDFVRGVDSDYGLRKLMEMGFVDVVGRSESLGRPLLYGTTNFFLEQFGLERLEALPTLREIEEILDDPAFNRERARLLELDSRDAAMAEAAREHAEPEGT